MSTRKTVAVENTAQAFLEMLEALGVRYLIGNAGTDFASIIDAFSKRIVDGKAAPRAMMVAHECCAVSMAHGYYLATGEPAVAMVHTTPGTANALGALMNAFRSNVPLVLCAGRTPLTEAGMPRQPRHADPLGPGVVRPGLDRARVRKVGLRTAQLRADSKP